MLKQSDGESRGRPTGKVADSVTSLPNRGGGRRFFTDLERRASLSRVRFSRGRRDWLGTTGAARVLL